MITSNKEFQESLKQLSNNLNEQEKNQQIGQLIGSCLVITFLVLGGLTVFFLWRIFLQNQNVLKELRSLNGNPNDAEKVNKKLAGEKFQATKQPSLEKQDSNSNKQHATNPDAPYMPKS